jgi:hypothetical protein
MLSLCGAVRRKGCFRTIISINLSPMRPQTQVYLGVTPTAPWRIEATFLLDTLAKTLAVKWTRSYRAGPTRWLNSLIRIPTAILSTRIHYQSSCNILSAVGSLASIYALFDARMAARRTERQVNRNQARDALMGLEVALNELAAHQRSLELL